VIIEEEKQICVEETPDIERKRIR
jgi:hypothetical protein